MESTYLYCKTYLDYKKYLDYKQNPYYFDYEDKSKIKESNIKPIIKKINFNKSTQTEIVEDKSKIKESNIKPIIKKININKLTEIVEDKTKYIPTIINDKLINPSNNPLIIKITNINDIEKKKKAISDYFYENDLDDDTTDIVI